MTFSSINPFIWHSSEKDINSKVLMFGMQDCTEVTTARGPRQRRSTAKTFINPSVSFGVELPLNAEAETIVVNEEPRDKYKMMHHPFEIGTNSTPVQLSVFPYNSSMVLQVYLRFEERSTTEDYDITMLMPHNISDATTGTESAEELHDMRHTTFISKDNLTRNGTYYVSVGYKGNI